MEGAHARACAGPAVPCRCESEEALQSAEEGGWDVRLFRRWLPVEEEQQGEPELLDGRENHVGMEDERVQT
jgi:hypothetical protein